MVNYKEFVDESKPVIYNKVGTLCNYVTIPMVQHQHKVDVTTFMYQNTDLNVDYPVFVSKESALLIKKRTETDQKSFNSEVQLKVYQNLKKIKILEEQKSVEENKLLTGEIDEKTAQKDIKAIQEEIDSLKWDNKYLSLHQILFSLAFLDSNSIFV